MSIAKSLRKAGHLGQFSGGLKEFVDMLKSDADQDEFNKLMTSAMDEIQSTYAGEDEPTYEPSRLQDLKKLPEPGDPDPRDFDPNAPPEIQIGEPEDMILGDVTGRKYGTMTADEQRMKIQRTIVDHLIKSGKLKDLDPNKLNQGTAILDLLGKSVTPKQKTSELKSFNPKNDLYEIDDEGNFTLVKEGEKDSKFKSVGSYTGKDGYNYTKMWDPETESIREVKSDKPVRPPKGTTVKIDYPEPEKWKDMGSIMNFIEYKEDPITGLLVATTEEEKKQNRKIAQSRVFSKVEPQAITFMQQRIWNAWNRENMSQADFESEVEEGIISGELSPEGAQDLLDYNQFRPYLYDELIETVKVNPEE